MKVAKKWGLPDWTQPSDYPAEATDNEWRWEFLRRRPDYREAWTHWSAKRVMTVDGISYCYRNPDDVRLRFGVSVIIDPRRSMSESEIEEAWTLFQPASGYATWDHEAEILMAGASPQIAKKIASRHKAI